MRFATIVFVRTCIAAPIAFVLVMALVWAVDKVWGVDSVLEMVHQREAEVAERDLWDRLAVGDEWL